MMKKRYVFLLLSLLACGGSMYANETGDTNGTSESMVTPENIASYDNLTYAITQIGKLSALEKDQTDAEATVAKLEATENPTTTAVNKYCKKDKNDPGKLYFTEVALDAAFVAVAGDRSILQELENQWIEEEECYYYSKPDKDWVAFPTGGNYGQEDPEGTIWSVMKSTDNVTKFKLSGECSELRVYYKNSAGEIAYQPVFESTSVTGFLANYIASYVKPFTDKIEGTKLPIDNEEALKALLGDGYDDWKTKYNEAKTAQTTAQAKYSEAKDLSDTKTWQIKADIIVPENATSISEWPTGRTLTGDYNHIINNSENPLFSENNGTIQNLFSLDIDIADEGTGRMRNCIIKSHWDNKYYIYGGVGTTGQGFASLEDAIYSERGTYGIDYSSNATVGRVTDATRLYAVQYANDEKTDASSYKANITAEGVYSRVGKLSCNNTVAYIDDVDDYVKGVIAGLTNVATKSGDSYVCAKAVLTDDPSSEEFYAPKAFTATNLSYDRTVKTKYASVCLPFELNADKLSNMHAKAYTYSHVDDVTGKMKFSPIASVGANAPCILAIDDDYVSDKNTPFQSFNRVNVSVTPAYLNSGEFFFGNYKAYQTAADLAAAVEEDGKFVYGVQKDKFVKMKYDETDDKKSSHMNAFRSFVLLSEDISQTPTGEARTFTISLLDEDGNEEVSGIELMSTANNNTNSDFKAVGGRNAIEITTGKACDVKVYTLNGALAKTARVEAGTTTLPMNAGMYVVNKTKVIVK